MENSTDDGIQEFSERIQQDYRRYPYPLTTEEKVLKRKDAHHP